MTLKQFIGFASDAAGIEKILRLLQALSQILAAVSIFSEDVKMWLLLRAQLALGRRYIRFFRFFDAFTKAWSCFLSSSGLELLLGVGKWSFLGSYLLLESITILDVMDVWPTPLAKVCFVEANKLWFTSLVCSIMLSFVQMFNSQGVKAPSRKDAKSKEKSFSEGSVRTPSQPAKGVEKHVAGNAQWRRLVRTIITDASDLSIPGAVTGWLVTGPITVGVATVISTILSSKDIWDQHGSKS